MNRVKQGWFYIIYTFPKFFPALYSEFIQDIFIMFKKNFKKNEITLLFLLKNADKNDNIKGAQKK